MQRVLIASPVKQKPEILKEFLYGLSQLDRQGIQLAYLFIDDNDSPISSSLLERFSMQGENVTVWEENTTDFYQCDNEYHKWHQNLIWKVAEFKNQIIKHALEKQYDYLFLIDSDVVIQPPTLVHLISLNLDIVAEVFWTKWMPDAMELPQVWVKDHYTLYESTENEQLSPEIIEKRTNSFLSMLRKTGTYQVGGLCACTLISKRALDKGVSFVKIPNLSIWGEDRHFCIRAQVLGFKLWADTYYPPYHIYRMSELEGLRRFKNSYFKTQRVSLNNQ